MNKASEHSIRRPSPPDAPEPLAIQLRELGMYELAERYAELAEEVRKAKSPYAHHLGALVNAQLAARMDRSFQERIARARFPALKTLESFDFAFQPTLDETHMRTLADLTFLGCAESVLFVGPPGWTY
jgi:DNA replication protein DnaC